MRIFTLSFITLLLFMTSAPTTSAQAGFTAQVSERVQLIVDTFTGNPNTAEKRAREKARMLEKQAEENARAFQERTKEKRNAIINTVREQARPNTSDQMDERDGRPNSSTTTNRGDRVRDAFERATQATTSTDRRAILERVRAQRTEHRENVKERVAEIHRERIHAFGERMFNRLQAAIDRLNTLADRINSRVERFEEANIDVSDAQQALADARAHIAVAQEHLDEADKLFEDIKQGNVDPRTIFTDAKDLVQEMTRLVRDAHASLVDVIRILKITLEENSSPEESDGDPEDEVETGTTEDSAATSTPQ